MKAQLKSYLKLINPRLVLFLAFAQFILGKTIIAPILITQGFDASEMGLHLYLLILTTAFMASGGAVLGQYFDVKINAVNQPEKQILGRELTKAAALRYYQILTLLGLICGLVLAYTLRNFTVAFVFLVLPGLIWFYSSNYKRQFLIGNLVFSFMISLSILMLAINEIAFLQQRYESLIYHTNVPRLIYCWVGGYAILAFLLSFIFDTIQDIKNEKGAREFECRTFCVCRGIKQTKLLLCCSIMFLLTLLLWALYFCVPFDDSLMIRYSFFALVLPLLCLIYLVCQAHSRIDFQRAQNLLKFIAVCSVLSCFVFYYLFAKIYGIVFLGLFLVH